MTACGQTGLYRVFGEADLLLYIGISKHFGVRWQQHAQKQPWWNERRRMTVDFYDDREEALDAEALAIFTDQPKYNVLHRKQALRLKRLRPGEVANKQRTPALVQLCPDWQFQELTKTERVTAARIMRFRTGYPDHSRIAESRECWSCRAKPGELCRTASGRLAYYHQARLGHMTPPAMSGRTVPAEPGLIGVAFIPDQGDLWESVWSTEPPGSPVSVAS
jgi:GIY-YIG catalytic domain